MKLTDLPKDVTLYKVAKALGITPSAAYKYQLKGVLPKLRVYELKEKHPEWFVNVKEEK